MEKNKNFALTSVEMKNFKKKNLTMKKNKNFKPKPTGLARMRKVWTENPDAFEKELERIPSTVSMSESSRKRWFKLFPNAERRYLDYIKKKSDK